MAVPPSRFFRVSPKISGFFPPVESVGELVHVAVQVLRAHLVEAADQPALEQAPEILGGVGVDVSAHVLRM